MDSLASFGSGWSLADDDDGSFRAECDVSGEVRVKVEYKDNRLLIHIGSARGLAAVDSTGYSDP